MKRNLLTPLSFIVLLCFACTSSNKKEQANVTSKVENGMYLVLNEYSDTSLISETNDFVIPYSHDFLDPNETGQPLMLAIDTSDYVPLDLATEPDSIQQPDKRINLMLTLTNSAKTKLADFTEKNLNKRVAMVIGGKAVTIHKVRTRIEGGQLQITRCTDNACEFLYLELKESYSK